MLLQGAGPVPADTTCLRLIIGCQRHKHPALMLVRNDIQLWQQCARVAVKSGVLICRLLSNSFFCAAWLVRLGLLSPSLAVGGTLDRRQQHQGQGSGSSWILCECCCEPGCSGCGVQRLSQSLHSSVWQRQLLLG
jgi:hypothetical protein